MRRRAGLAAVLCAAAGLFAATPAAAEEPAVDEYSVDLPGGGPSGVSGNALEPSQLPPGQPGVVGESSAPESSLSSLRGSIGDAPLSAAVAVAVLGLIVIAARRRSQRSG